MQFDLTEEQLQVKRMVREFAEAEIKPHVMEWDEAQKFPRELFTKMGELGLAGVIVPEEYGGAGMGYVEYATVIEEIARVCGSVGLSVAAHNSLCTNHILQYASEEMKRKYVPGLAKGEKLGAWGLTEPSSGSDASGMKTTAVRRNGGWVLNGSKNFITHGISADVCVALAITNREMRSRGISAFIVERGAPGFIGGKKENKLGMRASETASIIFEDCWVPDSNLLGEQGRGFVNSMQILDGGRISIAALALGIAQGAYESALKYAQERKQFGQPIFDFQGIQFKLADMATQIDAARLLVMRAAWLKDNKRPTTKESAMAKVYASEIAVKVSEEAIQIHGGYGYTKDYPPEKFWRDSKLCTIGEGTSEVQRLVIARQLVAS
ncbi:MAG TPA: acyl-CoA dehydrogenase [Blastocatellia bacterium]|nr:acyl-CoA dehydrogenase [Blastocatellia bacterium]HMZ20998.1 acyl-CoA dehydrogenase [Blastocatellia bacterium]HNG28814.1 acyl-CoA dehydrogenase [Blastocatellia bacterium]